MVEPSFERDLSQWVHRLYLRREQGAAGRARRDTERLFDRERHLLNGLSAQLLVTIAMLPWWGVRGIIAGLVVLYLGTIMSGVFTLRREAALARASARETPPRAAERALAACPPLDPPARALLVRIMNLSVLSPTPRGRDLLREDIHALAELPGLAAWPVLGVLRDLVEDPDWAGLAMDPSEMARHGGPI